ncbi:MAG: TetR/AcrR family transcriptional regulator [Candidatus Eiseniibacteriota bacterium]|jgi:AcrR family transcriptional regulator
MTAARRSRRSPAATAAPGTGERGEEKLAHLLATAARLMAEQGYDQTTIRHVGRATGYSLAGMYYYFESKEDLLFQIQQRTFASLLAEQEREVASASSAQERLERLVRSYLDFYVRNAAALKVCTFELESLAGEQYATIEALRHRWFRLARGIVGELLGVSDGRAASSATVRHYTLFVFGMLNWVFLWFDPDRDGPVDRVADQMLQLILHGLPPDGRVGTGGSGGVARRRRGAASRRGTRTARPHGSRRTAAGRGDRS